MGKLIFIVAVGIACCFAVVALSANPRLALNRINSDCLRACGGERIDGYALCRNVSIESSSDCRIAYRSCLNQSELTREQRMECSKNFTACKRAVNAGRVACYKNATTIFQGCKTSCMESRRVCIETDKAVCGADGVTYKNECQLNASNATKAYDSACKGCDEYTYSSCPAYCVKQCVASGEGLTDCDGPGSCIAPQCSSDRQCKAFVQHCDCSWGCGKAPEIDCARHCSAKELGPRPACGCADRLCVIG